MKLELYTQMYAMDCWFASAMMVLRYFGKTDKEYQQLVKEYEEQEVTDPQTGTGVVKLKAVMKQGGNEYIIMNLLGDKNIQTDLIYRQTNANFDQMLKDEIAAGRPVILGLNQGNGGHFVVAYAVNGADLLIRDPNPNAAYARDKISFNQAASAIIVTNVQ